MRHHHYDKMKDNINGEESSEDCYVLPCQKIFYLNDEMKDVINEMLLYTEFNLQNFEELNIDSFPLKEKEKKKNKEFLIVEREEIKKITHFPQIKEEFSDVNDLSHLEKKREREEPKKSKKKQKGFSNLYNLKNNKKYRNGDIDMNGNLEQYLKSQRNKNKCLGCCFCTKKKKSNKNLGCDIFSNEANLKLEKENSQFEEIIQFPSFFENPLECLNSETISKQDFNVFYEHLHIFMSNLTSVYCQRMRQLDEKKSNKKKFNIKNNNEKKKSRGKQILSDFEKGEIVRKIYTFNTNQLEEMKEKFNKYVTKENDELNFNIEEIPQNVLLEMREFVDKCYSDNLGNPLHQNYSKEIECKKKLAEQLNPKPIISYGDPRYPSNFQNLNFNKIRNSLLSDKDDEISNSLSSSSETSESPSISEVERKIKKKSTSNGCATSENFTSRNMMSKAFIEDDHSNSLSDREVCSSDSDEI